jgi:hypothetical protein
LASDPQRLLDAVRQAGGLAFLAHPEDPAAPVFGEGDLSWVDWEVDGFTGLEIWNFMSEFKSRLTSLPRALYYAYNPAKVASSPFPDTLGRWDQLLASGKRVVAIGGADAHAMPVRRGPLQRVVFPYDFLYGAVNTHVLTAEPLIGEAESDRRRLFHSLGRGQCFVGYDLPASTRGFRFTAQGDQGRANMGETVKGRFGVTLQVRLPQRAGLRLIRHGQEVRAWEETEVAVLTVSQPGAYRVEAYIPFHGKLRTWILSNPIYVSR